MSVYALELANSATAQCGSPTMSTSPLWLQVTQAGGAIATTVGVLIALYVAIIREPRETFEARKYHVARVDALHRMKSEHFGAQARKLVPSCVRTPMLGDSSWAVRLDNASNNVTTILGVEVAATDANGVEIPGGCRHVDHTTSVDPDVHQSIRLALSESLEPTLDHPSSEAFEQAIRDAVAVHFVNAWPRTLAPNHHAVMCYATVDPSHKLRVTIDYEDEAGFRWRRTDTGQPRRTDSTNDVRPGSACRADGP